MWTHCALGAQVSSFGVPGSHISPPCVVPLWWAVFPPDERTLQGLFDIGYRDACIFFSGWDSDLLTDEVKARVAELSSNYGQDVSESVVHFLIEVQSAWFHAMIVGYSFVLIVILLVAKLESYW